MHQRQRRKLTKFNKIDKRQYIPSCWLTLELQIYKYIYLSPYRRLCSPLLGTRGPHKLLNYSEPSEPSCSLPSHAVHIQSIYTVSPHSFYVHVQVLRQNSFWNPRSNLLYTLTVRMYSLNPEHLYMLGNAVATCYGLYMCPYSSWDSYRGVQYLL